MTPLQMKMKTKTKMNLSNTKHIYLNYTNPLSFSKEERGVNISEFLEKHPEEFTKKDILRYIKKNNIQFIRFCGIDNDGRIKAISFETYDLKHIDAVLSRGERIDASSIFPSIPHSFSDAFIVPIFKTAFLDPIDYPPTLNILCAYLNRNGDLLDIAPYTILWKAQELLFARHKLKLRIFGEIEFYFIYKDEEDFCKLENQKHYHEVAPFSKYSALRDRVLLCLSRCGIKTKYSHSEVGYMKLPDFLIAEQHEIELLPENIIDAANHICIAQWLIKRVAYNHNIKATFAPMLRPHQAGNGLHFHIQPFINNRNMIYDNKGRLTNFIKKIIGGILSLSPAITAFGNPHPLSYLRTHSGSEAPNSIFWGQSNRKSLIRLPLNWHNINTTALSIINQTSNIFKAKECIDTIEYRLPDGFAKVHLTIAAIAVAIHYGLTSNDSIEVANHLNSDTLNKAKIILKKYRKLVLPNSCLASASILNKNRNIFEKDGIFPPEIIDETISKLSKLHDKKLDNLLKNQSDEQLAKYIVKTYI